MNNILNKKQLQTQSIQYIDSKELMGDQLSTAWDLKLNSWLNDSSKLSSGDRSVIGEILNQYSDRC